MLIWLHPTVINESDNRAGLVGTGVVMGLIGLGSLIAAALTRLDRHHRRY